MTPITEIGEMLISDRDNDYFFRPSFSAMSSLGSPSDIVMTYSILNGYEITKTIINAIDSYGSVPDWLAKTITRPEYENKILSAAMTVMQACCDDDVSSLVGEWEALDTEFIYHPGQMLSRDIVTLARELAFDGIIGKSPLRVLQRNEGKSSFTNEFRAVDYINSARSHFNMPRSEAEQLTMTEFQLLLKNKYPDEKGFTKEEYDGIADDFLKRKAERLKNASQGD